MVAATLSWPASSQWGATSSPTSSGRERTDWGPGPAATTDTTTESNIYHYHLLCWSGRVSVKVLDEEILLSCSRQVSARHWSCHISCFSNSLDYLDNRMQVRIEIFPPLTRLPFTSGLFSRSEALETTAQFWLLGTLTRGEISFLFLSGLFQSRKLLLLLWLLYASLPRKDSNTKDT